MLQLALAEMPHGLCMFDGFDRLVLANRHYARIWNIPEELTQPGTSFAEIMAVTYGKETELSMAQPKPAPGSVGVRRREWQMDDGRTIQIVVTRLADGSSVALHEDVTEQRRAEAQIAYMARYDQTTGLPNRHAMLQGLDQLLKRNARGEELAVLCLDLDRFKAVNDTFGHAAGDALLRQVAERLRSCSRETDLVARLGGDEFAVLQCGASQPSASMALARRIIAALGEPFDLDGLMAQIGASIGIAIAPFDGETCDALLKNADLALYRAKADGRGTLCYFEPQMDLRTQARRALETDLRLAVNEHQFHLLYQPQVDITSGGVTTFEALLRWTHPTRGAISPLEFIAVAEETGLIVQIGRWVLTQACQDAMLWPTSVRLAVNASAVQFSQGSLLHDVTHALQSSGLTADRLEIEITETVTMQDPKQALASLKELQQMGVRVAMDDFGTGYSSLSYLHSFAFDRIKIDRSFVRDVDTNPGARAIIRAIVGLGESLGMAITVEGVETIGQLDVVREEGCHEIQGYLFSVPKPLSETMKLIEALSPDNMIRLCRI